MEIMHSPLDDYSESEWTVPRLLRPLFGTYDHDGPSSFWSDLAELDRKLALGPDGEREMGEMLHLAIVHMFGHEITHALAHHFDLRTADTLSDLLARHKMTLTEFKKGIELHADAGASYISIVTLLGQVGAELPPDSYKLAFHRFGYMTTLIYGLYDPQCKYLYGYKNNEYTHPIVRRQLAVEAMSSTLESVSPLLKESFDNTWTIGYSDCMDALKDLNIDCFLGKFGPVDFTKPTFPVHIGVGGPFSYTYVDEEVNVARDVLRRFSELASSFNQLASR